MAKSFCLFFFFFFFFVFLLLSSFFFCAESSQYEIEELSWLDGDDHDDEISMVQSRHASLRSCDFSTGKWVFDQSYPLYDPARCPYLSTAVSCSKNGRPDSDYQKWKWKPDGCTIPRFDALEFLGRMRRKRIMLVGDSIMRNQWESLVCLVQSVIPTDRKTVTYNGPSMAFHALDYETSIEFCWAPFLVELKQGAENKRILHLDLIEENARYWRGSDVLVFDSAHWWTHSQNRSSWDYIMEGTNFFRYMNPMVAYEKGLMTWAKWIDLNVDPRKSRVFFRSMSPKHNRENGWKCFNEREPLEHFSRPRVPQQLVVLKQVLRRMNFPVYLQDISTMSAFRRDGHPSVYGKVVGQEEKQHLRGYKSDCSHWCLPGVPDIWNEMLNAMV